MSKLLTIAPSPHVKGDESIQKIMYGVIIALLPALIMSTIFFGFNALKVTLIAVASCILFEFFDSEIYSKG
jgi:Predicted NADH:ubiquinone oxidoreductase, subunit RnfD